MLATARSNAAPRSQESHFGEKISLPDGLGERTSRGACAAEPTWGRYRGRWWLTRRARPLSSPSRWRVCSCASLTAARRLPRRVRPRAPANDRGTRARCSTSSSIPSWTRTGSSSPPRARSRGRRTCTWSTRGTRRWCAARTSRCTATRRSSPSTTWTRWTTGSGQDPGGRTCLAEYCDVLRCDASGWRATDAKARFEHALMPSGSTRMNATRPRWRARARARARRRAVAFPAASRRPRRRRLRGGRAAARARTFPRTRGFLTCGGVEEMPTRWRGTGRAKQAQARVRVARGARAGGVHAAVASRRRIRRRTWRRRRRRGLGVVGEEAEKIVASLLARFGVKRRKRKKQM